ncbi:MAG: hypothetical protein PUI40_01600 [Oscillospiraceae bacterium]|nr:hypothetical protein [Oscillospiraceae bacterium]MDY2610562.1 hypothetical protein [Oscillospiraceae bacterium]
MAKNKELISGHSGRNDLTAGNTAQHTGGRTDIFIPAIMAVGIVDIF